MLVRIRAPQGRATKELAVAAAKGIGRTHACKGRPFGMLHFFNRSRIGAKVQPLGNFTKMFIGICQQVFTADSSMSFLRKIAQNAMIFLLTRYHESWGSCLG